MNDTGAGESVEKAEQELELPKAEAQVNGANEPDAVEKDREAREKQRSDYRDPSLWWFASTGCPLIAGTFGPLANAFSICALARTWRVYIPPGESSGYGTHIPDPGWLLAINAVSLVFALVANGALLLNMSKRLRFKIAQPISVIGFFLAAVLLIVAIAIFTSSPTYHLAASDPAAPSASHALTSAFYYAIQAAAIYFIITGLMFLTGWGVYKGHFEESFRLTTAQRTLMLQTMSFVTYLLLGALVFSHTEDWEYLDALYWADLTLLTIGLGSDFHPATHTGGIIIIGLVIGSIRTLVLDRGKRKLSARIMEKKRVRAINSVSPGKNRIKVGSFINMKFNNAELDHSKRRELEFNVMRKVQDYAEHERKWMALAISSTAALGLWFIGALVFTKSEVPQGWDYFDSLYFTYTCLTTIGYGDLYPESFSGKAFFVLWTLLAVPTLTILISDMSDTVVAAFSEVTMWIGTLTVLPSEHGFRATMKMALKQITNGRIDASEFGKDTPPGLLGEAANPSHNKQGVDTDRADLVDDITERLAAHLEEQEMADAISAGEQGHTQERDTHFYHVVLAREIRRLMRDLGSDPPTRYSWQEWEYFLRLMDNVDTTEDNLDRKDKNKRMPDWGHLVPKPLRTDSDVAKFEKGVAPKNQTWTWLGADSPLLSYKSETEWVLERLGTTLERELQVMRRGGRDPNGGPGRMRPPPVSLSEMIKSGNLKQWKEKRNSSTSSSGAGENNV
ncbi:hypothetical protein ANO11243_051170 [Dothideomycetidae sp. 11243]|nr:hypothetical protein ANO11243_051170 [fungal sp. No.11243]